jgi:hypothetical protein
MTMPTMPRTPPAEPTGGGPRRRTGRARLAGRGLRIGLGLITSGVATLGVTAPAAAAPHKILVLPADGTADAATRAKLTTQMVKLSKGLGGQVATAEATFADTALAVGCAPEAPGCSDQVIATLGVDELVWATVTKDGGQARVVVRHATKGAVTREATTTVAPGESTEQIDAGLAPVFAPPAGTPDGGIKPAVPPTDAKTETPPAAGEPGAAQPLPPGLPEDPHDRNLGIGLAVGGGVAVVLGLALWASYSSVQDSIDTHKINTRADFDDLTALEDRAATYAIAGDLLVLAGLAAGGVGGYFLYRSQHEHRIAVTPAPIAGGAGLTLTILGGL